MSERWFAVTATVIGLLFIAITPPFQVPDEWNHYVRSEAIAQGHVVPNMTWQGDCESFPAGVERFVRAVYRTSGKFELGELRQAATIRRDVAGRAELCFPAWYTPVPYAPQVAIALASRIANVRPFITFYAGRLANLAFAVLLMMAAMRIAPEHRAAIAAVALLPMTMYQLASWSADAPTLAIAILLTALLLRAIRREHPATAAEVAGIAVLSFVLALCKPVYFLIALLALAIPRRRFRSVGARASAVAAILVTVAIGVAISSVAAEQARFNSRFGLHVDADEQAQCIRNDPARFTRVVANDLRTNGTAYIEEMIGRLGMNDLKVPLPVIWIELLLLVVVALMQPSTARFLAFGIVIATVGGIVLAQYLIWSVVCSPLIEGVQGRYFLPVLLLGMVSLGAGRKISERVQSIAIVAVAAAANAAALVTLVQRYWI